MFRKELISSLWTSTTTTTTTSDSDDDELSSVEEYRDYTQDTHVHIDMNEFTDTKSPDDKDEEKDTNIPSPSGVNELSTEYGTTPDVQKTKIGKQERMMSVNTASTEETENTSIDSSSSSLTSIQSTEDDDDEERVPKATREESSSSPSSSKWNNNTNNNNNNNTLSMNAPSSSGLRHRESPRHTQKESFDYQILRIENLPTPPSLTPSTTHRRPSKPSKGEWEDEDAERYPYILDRAKLHPRRIWSAQRVEHGEMTLGDDEDYDEYDEDYDEYDDDDEEYDDDDNEDGGCKIPLQSTLNIIRAKGMNKMSPIPILAIFGLFAYVFSQMALLQPLFSTHPIHHRFHNHDLPSNNKRQAPRQHKPLLSKKDKNELSHMMQTVQLDYQTRSTKPKSFHVRMMTNTEGRNDDLGMQMLDSLKRCSSVGSVEVLRNGEKVMDGNGAKSDVVLLLRDDVLFTCDELDRAFSVWLDNPHRLVGFFPQSHNPQQQPQHESLTNNKWNHYNILSDRAVFLHKTYLTSKPLTQALEQPNNNNNPCSNLALSVAVTSITSQPPLAIASQPLEMRSSSTFHHIQQKFQNQRAQTECVEVLMKGFDVEILPWEDKRYIGDVSSVLR